MVTLNPKPIKFLNSNPVGFRARQPQALGLGFGNWRVFKDCGLLLGLRDGFRVSGFFGGAFQRFRVTVQDCGLYDPTSSPNTEVVGICLPRGVSQSYRSLKGVNAASRLCFWTFRVLGLGLRL